MIRQKAFNVPCFCKNSLLRDKTELNVDQGQRTHTLLRLYSEVSLIDHLPVLSEGRIFTPGATFSEDRYAHAARTDPANETCDAESTGS